MPRRLVDKSSIVLVRRMLKNVEPLTPSASLEALSLTLSVGWYFGTVDCGVRRKARASASCWFFFRGRFVS